MPAWAGMAAVVVGVSVSMVPNLTRAADRNEQYAFKDPASLEGWETAGDVSIDAAREHEGAAVLRIAPGGKAVRAFRKADGSGRVTFSVYDEFKPPADPKQRRVGPRWGLQQADGHILGVGQMYAPYLAGNTTYSTTEYDGKTWFNVQYLGECRRSTGWHTWTFDMDADQGLSITFDGKNVNEKRRRFDWNRTTFGGFTGVVLMGDEVKGTGETLWVAGVDVTLGTAMTARPTPPPPPPPVVPKTDPAVEGKPVRLLDSVLHVHPRLLFGPAELPVLKAHVRHEQLKPFMQALLDYLPACKPPDHTNFLKDATDGQRQGLWRMPTVALHYALTGDESSRKQCVGFMKLLLGLTHWEVGEELDSGMSAANIMIGAALAYDWLYTDLDPDFREQFRRKLFDHARAMYYGGHLMKNPGTHYWQSDPLNNHRWHRNAGLTLCLLAAAEGKPEEDWLVTQTTRELEYVAQWLPPDGTSHESPSYLVFGLAHLVLAMQAADRCLGTEFLQRPFFDGVGKYMAQTLTPGLEERFSYGDGTTGVEKLGYDTCLYETAALHGQSNVQQALNDIVAARSAEWGWMGLVWLDPTVPPGRVADLPHTALFPDLGLLILRTGWAAGDTAAMFKCGPLGGYTLNAFRNANDYRYINVAHDDPDANSFVILSHGAFLAETDRYSKHKQSANHNTILVNGMGQTVIGRPEGQVWSQPGRGDMTRMAYLTAWKDAGDCVVVEGEAAGAYPADKDKHGHSRPALDRYRRTFVWVNRAYILVLDDIRAPQPVDIEWLLQAPVLHATDESAGRYRLSKDDVNCAAQVLCSRPHKARIVEAPADHRGNPLGWRQLRLGVNANAARFVSVYAPWGGTPTVARLDWGDGAEGAITFTVTGDGDDAHDDRWSWAPAPDNDTAATLELTRGGKTVLTVGPRDKAPRE